MWLRAMGTHTAWAPSAALGSGPGLGSRGVTESEAQALLMGSSSGRWGGGGGFDFPCYLKLQPRDVEQRTGARGTLRFHWCGEGLEVALGLLCE